MDSDGANNLNNYLEQNPSLPVLVLGPLVSGRTQLIKDFLDRIKTKQSIFWQWDFFEDGGRALEPVREGLAQFRTRPVPGERRVVFLDNIDLLNLGVANLLLKFLEEPPAQTTIILSAYAVAEVPPTIVSRCFLLPVQPNLELQKNNPSSFGFLGLAKMLENLGEPAEKISFKEVLQTPPYERLNLLSEVLPETMKIILGSKEEEAAMVKGAKKEAMMLLEWWLLALAYKPWQDDFKQNQQRARLLIAARQLLASEKPKTVLESLCYNL